MPLPGLRHTYTCGSLVFVQIIAAMHAYPSRPRTAWVREWPAMVVLAVSQIFWARGVEEALTQGTVQVGTPASSSDIACNAACATADHISSKM